MKKSLFIFTEVFAGISKEEITFNAIVRKIVKKHYRNFILRVKNKPAFKLIIQFSKCNNY